MDEVPVNWCPGLGTVLANEEVIDGKSEVGGFPVERRPMRQWMLRITAYADRLLEDLDLLEWPESLKEMQRNWIGRSVGAEVDFDVVAAATATSRDVERGQRRSDEDRRRRPGDHRLHDAAGHAVRRDVHGAGPGAPAGRPDHPAGAAGDGRGVPHAWSPARASATAWPTTKEKTGVFTGAYAINPVNDERIPVYIADYVLMGYGTGAIMAVPAHDERDFEFAKKFRPRRSDEVVLRTARVRETARGAASYRTDRQRFVGRGRRDQLAGRSTACRRRRRRSRSSRCLDDRGHRRSGR